MAATKAATISARFKWNRSQLIETNTYVKVYTETLNKILPPDDRQTLFIVSKLFADGAAESGRRRLHMARYFFDRGEKYVAAIPAENAFLKQFLTNIYDRSKSFYHYRTGNIAEAIRLVHNAIDNNQALEANGFEFLVFDRVSQYHNLSKIYFGLQQPERAFEILSDAIGFLIAGRSQVLEDLNNNFVTEYTADLREMRYSLMAQLLFETTTNLQKETDKEAFLRDSAGFFQPILRSSQQFMVLEESETLLQKWLAVVALFYEQKPEQFKQAAEDFLESEPPFLRSVPQQLLRGFLSYN